TLVQQLVAGVADLIVCRPPTEQPGQHFQWQQGDPAGWRGSSSEAGANRMGFAGNSAKDRYDAPRSCLTAVIAAWRIFGETERRGFRTTGLARPGRLGLTWSTSNPIQ